MTDVDLTVFLREIGETGVQILDVRTPAEFSAGHLVGAVNIDVQSDDFDKRIDGLDRSKTYAVYCRAGRRSTIAAEKLGYSGFNKVINLSRGGFEELKEAGAQTE